jgi:hypothetical protein
MSLKTWLAFLKQGIGILLRLIKWYLYLSIYLQLLLLLTNCFRIHLSNVPYISVIFSVAWLFKLETAKSDWQYIICKFAYNFLSYHCISTEIWSCQINTLHHICFVCQFLFQKPIVPADLYRSIRDSQLIGVSGYTREVLILKHNNLFSHSISPLSCLKCNSLLSF